MLSIGGVSKPEKEEIRIRASYVFSKLEPEKGLFSEGSFFVAWILLHG